MSRWWPFAVPVLFVLLMVGVVVNKMDCGSGSRSEGRDSYTPAPRRTTAAAELEQCAADRDRLEDELRRVQGELEDEHRRRRSAEVDRDDAEYRASRCDR